MEIIPHHYFNKNLKFQISDNKRLVKIYGETNDNNYNIILEFPVEAIDRIHEAFHRDA
ncbi:MAG: hypothetical protein R2685_10470 [Candidatus Nitrosocosmicus sp.]|nr:hypothetical protein [Candidatus Nitrosocosmicus sp.]